MQRRRIEPGPGQESVWDYPRPPKLERTNELVVVELNGHKVAESRNPFRVLETSHPPVYYIDPADIDSACLRSSPGVSFCEYKGEAHYWDIVVADIERPRAGWFYPLPTAGFTELRDFVAIYASKMDACWINGEQVQAQEGDFYGGWVTKKIVGPLKGGPGTWGW